MYRWVDHTAEVELHVDAESPAAVFDDATRALAELLGPGTGEPRVVGLEAQADDLAALLAAFIEELVFLAETEQFVGEEAAVTLGNGRLSAQVRGRIGDPPPLVKAVTYHGLSFEEVDGRWRARVVLDV